MIYRLRFCNKEGIEARVDIQKGLPTPVIDVDGTDNPFALSYNNDKGNKSGMFLSSNADIEIYETTDFNIDNLKTSNETELAVTYYINNIVKWKGFIIPDFFSIEVRSNPVIVMTASDRLGTLKSVTLSDLPSMVNIRELAVLCLNKTGLTLPLKTMADFSNGTGVNDFFNSKILTQRLSDTKGRSISCYDILSSILTASNSKLSQRGGEWVIINKVQHEAGSGKLFSSATSFINWSDVIFNFSDINVGGRRTIIPVAASTGVYHEHGGGRLHPDNYDFSKGLTGWSAVGDFTASIDNRQIDGFQTQGGQAGYFPIYGAETENSYLVNYNQYERNVNPKYLESAEITIPYNGNGAIEVEVDVNATGPLTYPGSSFAPATLRISVVAVSGTETLTLDHSGKFIPMPSTNPPIFSKDFGKALPVNDVYKADSIGMKVKGTLEVGSLENYKLKVRIYGGTGGRTILVNMVSLSMKNTQEIPKGNIYKIEQGSNFTKEHEIDTSIWGDYLTGGLNGYFYNYPIDDTSSLYNSSNELTSKWTAYNDTEQLPLLQHVSRQKSRLFSIAHDLLSAEIEASNFDPLAIFVSCEKRYTVVSAQFDFFKSNLSVELEEVTFQNNVIREYIYSYFGEGDGNIKNIGGISSGTGGGGTGGGLTPEQLEILSWWKKDPVNPNTIYTEMNAYSMGELSAYGIGSGGSSGGGVDLLQAWTDYDSAKDNWAVKAGLLVPFYNDTKSRLTSLEGGAALSLNVTGSGNAIASLTKSGTALTAVKGNFAELDVNGKILSSQLPSYVDDVLEYVNLAAFPATGETGKIYIAQDSNKTYRWSGTAYVEISASLALGETSSTAYRGDRGKTAYDHSQSEHQAIINGTGFVKANGKTLSYDNNSYSLSSHNHSGIYEPVLGNPSTNGYLLSSTTAGARSWVAPYSLPTASASVLGGVKIGTNVSIASGVISVHNPVTIGTANGLSLSTQELSLALATTAANGALSATDKTYIDLLKTFFEYDSTNNAIKALKSFYSTGEVSAYGIGSGGSSGGSYERLDKWADYDSTKAGWVLSAFLGNELNTRVGNLEGGSALTVNTTGTGNAITSISKAGTVITANKDLTFSLSGHTHTISDITNLQTALNSKLETSIFNTHNNDNVRHITGAERTKWDGVVTDFAGLEIGGRNYFKDTQLITHPSGFVKPIVQNGDISNITVNWDESQRYIIEGLFPSNGVYVISGHYSQQFSTERQMRFFLNNSFIGNVLSASGVPVRFEISVTVANYEQDTIGFAAIGGEVPKILKLKVEKGTIPTDWSPAPEDQVPDWNTTDVNSFSFIKNKPTSLSQFTDNIGVATHIANKTNPHNVTKAQVGLGNVDNTSDLLKPISNAMQNALNLKANLASPTFSGTVTAPTFIGALNGNATSATALQTARTIWGQSFNGEANVSGAMTGVTSLAMTGALSGATTIAASTSVTSPKVIFNAAGWSMEQVGSELQMKHNNVLKMRFTSAGSIVATEEITAFG